jgi:hypothetical protein
VAAPNETTREWALWVVVVSCASHAAEEYLTGWKEWARQTLGIVMPTVRFLVANGVLVVVALLLARVGWRRPALSLIIPSATLVNAVFFHTLPTIVQSRVSPGIYTAALLYVPFSSWALIGAARAGVARTAIATADGCWYFDDGKRCVGSETAGKRKLGRLARDHLIPAMKCRFAVCR